MRHALRNVRRIVGGQLEDARSLDAEGAHVEHALQRIDDLVAGVRMCHGLLAGIQLDPAKNQVRGQETKISAIESNTEIWIVPTNEELIVAKQTEAVLNAN